MFINVEWGWYYVDIVVRWYYYDYGSVEVLCVFGVFDDDICCEMVDCYDYWNVVSDMFD